MAEQKFTTGFSGKRYPITKPKAPASIKPKNKPFEVVVGGASNPSELSLTSQYAPKQSSGQSGNTTGSKVPNPAGSSSYANANAAQDQVDYGYGGAYSQPSSRAFASGGGEMPLGYTVEGAAQAFDSPDVIAFDILNEMGINNPEMVDALTPLVDAAWAMQYVLNAGAPGYEPTAADVMQFVVDYLSGVTTPGGGVPDLGTALAAIAGADPNSILGSGMAEGGPAYVNALVRDVVRGAGLNPYYQQGMSAMMNSASQGYNSDRFRGAQGIASDPYYQYLASGPYGSYFGG